ncbi:MAG TPA: NHL repeat-containing protein [Dehalococcoidia bacterium]|nr:NHL repeat-containing protein [Dehalococcoidia bacterium]
MLAGRNAKHHGSWLSRSRPGFGWFVLVPGLAAAVALVSLGAAPWEGPAGRAPAFPAALAVQVDPEAPGYTQPADAIELDGSIFVLDTGNNRILVQDVEGRVDRTIDGSGDGQPALKGPMAIATAGGLLYVANSGASQVLVMETTGRLVKTIDLVADGADGAQPRPVGLAVAPDGSLWVSDPEANRILQYGAEGQLLRSVGGERAGGADGFNAPTGITVDASGSVYVVDTLNSRLVKLSPEGNFQKQFGRPGDTAGTFSRPKDVAVDGRGNVYASDGLLAAVQVFSADGKFLGFIGRSDPDDRGSDSLFKAPAGLSVAGERLYVVDRFAGLFIFDLNR